LWNTQTINRRHCHVVELAATGRIREWALLCRPTRATASAPRTRNGGLDV